MSFDADQISDEKRVARLWQWQTAQQLLRKRDHVHNARWRAMILPGRAPTGEILTIKKLMPKAVITAVDKDPVAIEAARAAGADETIECDLSAISRAGHYGSHWYPPKPLLRRGFDVVHLDFCGVLTPELKRLVGVYNKLVASGGVLMLTFAYGRDVVEAFGEADPTLVQHTSPAIGLRLSWLFGLHPERTWTPWKLSALFAHSIVGYRGASMPMCSVLASRQKPGMIPYREVKPRDIQNWRRQNLSLVREPEEPERLNTPGIDAS